MLYSSMNLFWAQVRHSGPILTSKCAGFWLLGLAAGFRLLVSGCRFKAAGLLGCCCLAAVCWVFVFAFFFFVWAWLLASGCVKPTGFTHVPGTGFKPAECEGCLGCLAWLCGLVVWFVLLSFCLGLCFGLVGWLVLLSGVFGLGLGTGCLRAGCVKPSGFE